MYLENLATELVTQIFLSCTSVEDVLNLSSTCHRFRHIYASSRKLPILETVSEAQYGPLHDITQLLTHNASQPAHCIRSVPFSLALLAQIVRTGRVAEKWCTIYPFKKWKQNFSDRRLLTTDECYRLRRALYRLWLYSSAFHNRNHVRETRMSRLVVHERACLLHNWSTTELAEIADIHAVVRDVIHANVCPSNGTISRKFKKRFPENDHHQLLFNIHLNYPPPVVNGFHSQYHASPNALSTHFTTVSNNIQYAKFRVTSHHEPGSEGWGDDIAHYYVVEDMMKLDPAAVMWLKEHAPFKSQVEGYVRELGEWFNNNGETWAQTCQWVLEERGEDSKEILEAVAEGELGITLAEE